MPVRYALNVGALLTMQEAQARVLEHVRTLAAESVAVGTAAGRVTAEPARAVVDLPPFASSAMDGYAVRAADLPGRLPVVGQVAAGRPSERPLAPGEAMAISTGGVVPDGADAVIPIEYVVLHDNTIEVDASLHAGKHVRPRGGDARTGDVVVEAGVRLGAAQLGALAAAGLAAVSCVRRPHVVVLATGTELAPPGEPLAPGQVYEANALMLAAALAASGADIDVLPAVADEESAHRAALERGLAADVLVTSGGVSVGPHDLVRRIEVGARCRGGLLARCDQARQAGLVRRARRDARVRAARQSGVGARRLRALRKACAARAARAARSPAAVRGGPARLAAPPEWRSRRARAGAGPHRP